MFLFFGVRGSSGLCACYSAMGAFLWMVFLILRAVLLITVMMNVKARKSVMVGRMATVIRVSSSVMAVSVCVSFSLMVLL